MIWPDHPLQMPDLRRSVESVEELEVYRRSARPVKQSEEAAGWHFRAAFERFTWLMGATRLG